MNLWLRTLALASALIADFAWCAPANVQIVYADYRPYSWSDNGHPTGLEIDILNEAIGKRLGLPIVHRILPWERAQQNVKAGDADAFVATPNEQRAQFADASATPVTYWELALYVRKGDTRFSHIKNISELSPYRIGSMIGNGWTQTNLAHMDVYYVGKMEQLPKMLLLDRIDVIPDNPLVMRSILHGAHNADKIDEVALDYMRRDMFLFVGKHSALHPYLADINTILLQMKRDGSLQRIHDKYYKNAGGN